MSAAKSGVMIAMIVFYGGASLLMIIAPETFYTEVDGVSNTGDYNIHFIRDIGLIYGTMSVSLILALAVPRFLFPLTLVPLLWVALHALLHVWDILAGRLPPEHWLIDIPGVFLPAIIHGAVAWWVKADWDRMSRSTTASA